MQDEVKVLAIDKAFAAGVISQNQADAMKANDFGGMMDGFRPRLAQIIQSTQKAKNLLFGGFLFNGITNISTSIH